LDVELLLAREPGDLLLELRFLLALREQHLVELLADLLRGAGDLGDLAHVVLVGLLLARLLAALDPEDEQDDDQDREGDQADEAEQRRQVRRAARRTLRAARAPARDQPLRPRGALLRRRLVLEEVEVDV